MTTPLQFGGLASGLDTKSIIDALVNAEQRPLLRLRAQRKDLESRKTAYTQVSTALTSLLDKAKAFTLFSAGAARSAASTDISRLTVAATANAAVGQYQLTVGRLASTTRATSTAAVGTAITDASATGTLSSLPLPGSVTAGQVSVVVDGTVTRITIGDPTTTSLKSVEDALAAAIQTQVQATDPGATVTASIVGNRIQFAMAGGTVNHDVRFGVGGDTSNALTILGLAGVGTATFSNAATVTGTSSLGVVRSTQALDSAGLTGLTSTTTGVMTINGVAIGYDTTVDSLNGILTRINNSTAGVVASVDRLGDRIVLSQRAAGTQAIDIRDTSGTLASAMKLAPGTSAAQVLGQDALITVDGRTITASSNHITNAIDGVTLDLVAQTAGPVTVTVGVDNAALKRALNDYIGTYNTVAGVIDSLTQSGAGKIQGQLTHEAGVRGISMSLRGTMMRPAAGLTGPITSLADIGVSSGTIGSAVGTTNKLTLDEVKLDAALDTNPSAVAQLLDAATGAIKPVVDQLTTLTGSGGIIDAGQAAITSMITASTARETDLSRRLDLRKQALERKYASLEASMAKLQNQSSTLTNQINSFNKPSA